MRAGSLAPMRCSPPDLLLFPRLPPRMPWAALRFQVAVEGGNEHWGKLGRIGWARESLGSSNLSFALPAIHVDGVVLLGLRSETVGCFSLRFLPPARLCHSSPTLRTGSARFRHVSSCDAHVPDITPGRRLAPVASSKRHSTVAVQRRATARLLQVLEVSMRPPRSASYVP